MTLLESRHHVKQNGHLEREFVWTSENESKIMIQQRIFHQYTQATAAMTVGFPHAPVAPHRQKLSQFSTGISARQ